MFWFPSTCKSHVYTISVPQNHMYKSTLIKNVLLLKKNDSSYLKPLMNCHMFNGGGSVLDADGC